MKLSVLQASRGTRTVHHPSEGALSSSHSTAPSKTPQRVRSAAQIRGWTINKPYRSPEKRQMWFLGLVCIQAGCQGLQEGKICNKQNLRSRPRQSYPGATHTSGWLRSGQDSLTVRHPAPVPCYSRAKRLLALRKACPLETLKAPDFLRDICTVCTFQLGNKHLHLASKVTMLSRLLLVYRYVGKQKEMWPRPVKDALLKTCFSTWQGVRI